MAEDTPISETDAIFAPWNGRWRPRLPPNDHLIYKFADALQYSDNPSYTGGSAGSYIQQLRSYIDWVKTGTRLLRGCEHTNYFKVQGEAISQFNMVKEFFPGMAFWKWAETNYPPLAAAEKTLKSIQTELYQAMQMYFGPDATTLSTYIDQITNAQGALPIPGGVKPPSHDIDQSTIRVPAYTIQTYNSTVQAWITAAGYGAPKDQVITIDIKNGQDTTWSEYGFKEVRGGGGGGFWPFFSCQVYVNNQWETRTLETQNRENEVSLSLAMVGIQKFDIQPGLWDVAGIKTLFPNRVEGAPDVLSEKYARIVSVLVGYGVELRVTFASSMRDEVNKLYTETKETGGSMNIFGFRVSAGAGGGSSECVNARFDDIQWSQETGELVLTPTHGQVYPAILAAVAQRFDS
ncbi:hypothetical protein H0H92_007486 [Tricholoma furcatifolium]|nr:hypothetical protein H0H92_007486 [Tricholoma furcatifolium]